VNDSLFYRSREANTGYAKSYVYEDLVHVLQAIIDEFYEHLTWPDDNCMHELATVYSGILRGCVGVGGVKEYETEKPKDSVKEKKSWSGKKKIDCYKMLSVMGHTGRFIFLSICLGKKWQGVLSIYRKENSLTIISGCHLMGWWVILMFL
jgi:hypothetical protein